MKGWAAVSGFDGTIALRDAGGHRLLHYGFADEETIAPFPLTDFRRAVTAIRKNTPPGR